MKCNYLTPWDALAHCSRQNGALERHLLNILCMTLIFGVEWPARCGAVRSEGCRYTI